MNDATQSAIRAGLKVGAGFLAAKGIGDDTAWEIVIAGVIGAIGIVWGLMHRSKPAAK